VAFGTRASADLSYISLYFREIIISAKVTVLHSGTLDCKVWSWKNFIVALSQTSLDQLSDQRPFGRVTSNPLVYDCPVGKYDCDKRLCMLMTLSTPLRGFTD